MKILIAISLTFILFGVSVVSAQEKKITEQESDAVRQSAVEKLKIKS